MFWQELKRMYFGWLCICANMCIMNLYMCCLVFKNINGTKCRCRNFQQHKRFISWFIRLTPQTIYRLYKIRIWVQRNSIPSKYPQRKQIHKTETNKISGKKIQSIHMLISTSISTIRIQLTPIDGIFPIPEICSQITLHALSFLNRDLQIGFWSISSILTIFKTD